MRSIYLLDSVDKGKPIKIFRPKIEKIIPEIASIRSVDKDEAEVKCAFMSLWTENTLGICTYPVGIAWSYYYGNREIFNEYIKEWTPVFDAFQDWKSKQR